MSVVDPTARCLPSKENIRVRLLGRALNSRSPRWRGTRGFGPRDRRFDSGREDLTSVRMLSPVEPHSDKVDAAGSNPVGRMVRSSAGRTPRSHRGSRGFKSSRTNMGSWGSSPILLASRASDGSSNLSDPTMPAWPNWIRLLVSNQPITGSNPVAGVRRSARVVTARTADPMNGGSNPSFGLRGGSLSLGKHPTEDRAMSVRIRPSLTQRLQLPRGRERDCRSRRSGFEAQGADSASVSLLVERTNILPCGGRDLGSNPRRGPCGLVAQFGRASSLREDGRRFKSGRVHRAPIV